MDLKRLQDGWQTMGSDDPLWAVLTIEEKRGGAWDVDAFLATGAAEFDEVRGYLAGLGLAPAGRALDFGCGVGRVTQAIADHFDETIGVDIAPSMVEHAARLNRHGDSCRYVLNVSADLRQFGDGEFGLIYSNIVLQHMHPRVSAGYLSEFCRLLAPNGVLVVQLPAGTTTRGAAVKAFLKRVVPAALLRAAIRIRTGRTGNFMAMHAIPRERVIRLLQEGGCRVVDVVEDQAAGAGWQSFRYCAVRD